MRYYETIFITHPDLTDEDYQAALTRSREVIEKENGVFVKFQEWGKQRLAYSIKKQDKGSYVLVNYCGQGNVSTELERILKLDDRILKAMTVKLEDEADPEELLRREQEAKSGSAAPAEESSSEETEDDSGHTEGTEEEANA